MRRLYIFLTIILLAISSGEGFAQRAKYNRNHSKHRTTRVKNTGKKSKGKSKKVVAYKPTIHDYAGKLSDPRFLNDPNYDPFLQCEDTCDHVHGIDLSHYQGEVFWETVGDNY